MTDTNPGPAESQSSNQTLSLTPDNLTAALVTGVNDSMQSVTNTALIQNSLNSAITSNQPKVSIVVNGTIYVNTLYIPDGVTLYVGPQTILRGGPNNLNNLINAASELNPQFTINTLSWDRAAGLITATTATAHGLSTGNWVAVYFTFPDGYDGVFLVNSVPDATHFTYSPYIKPDDVGGVGTVTIVSGGSSYVSGTYTAVPLTGGSGSGAKATVIVTAGVVTSVTITTPGSLYLLGDTGLSASNTNLGGSGSGLSLTVLTSGASVPTNVLNQASANVVMTGRKAQRFAGLQVDGILDYGTSTPAGGLQGDLVRLDNVMRVQIFGPGKFQNFLTRAIDVANIVDLEINWPWISTTGLFTDGIHINGPILNGIIRSPFISNCPEDGFGIGGVDYSNGTRTAGAIQNLVIENPIIRDCGHLFEIFGGRPTTTDTKNWKTSVTIRNVIGSCKRPVGDVTGGGGGPVFIIADDAGDPNTTFANIGVVNIDGVRLTNSRDATGSPSAYDPLFCHINTSTFDRLILRTQYFSPEHSSGFIELQKNCDLIDIELPRFGESQFPTNIVYDTGSSRSRSTIVNITSGYADTASLGSILISDSTAAQAITVNVIGGSYSGGLLVYLNGSSNAVNLNFIGATLAAPSGAQQYIAHAGTAACVWSMNGCNLTTIGQFRALSSGNLTISGSGNTLGTPYLQANSTGSIIWKTSASIVPAFNLSNGVSAGLLQLFSNDAIIDVSLAAVSTSVFPQWAQSSTAGAGKAGLAVKINNGNANTWYAIATTAGANTLIV